MTSEMKQQQLEWRRGGVLELASEGYSQRETANKLGVDLAAMNRNIQLLRQQANETLQKHIHETVPEESKMYDWSEAKPEAYPGDCRDNSRP
jgi:Trp operon repressor